MPTIRGVDVVALLRTFVAVAETRNISKAARVLHLSVPVASRHLRALEDDFGVRLVRRTTRQLDLTAAGIALLPRARRVLREFEDARESVLPGKEARGLLVVSAPVSFGLSQLAPLLPKLLGEHPKLSIDLRLDDRAVDLIGDGVDLALRTGMPPPDSPFVLARKLATYERILCAAPGFLEKYGPVRSVDGLAAVPCVTLGASPTRWQFKTARGSESVVIEGRVRSNNVLALRAAALAGLGVAQLPRWLIDADLTAQRLVRLLEGASLPTVDVLGLMHVDARRSRPLRLVQEFLAAELPRALS
jgi:DNA-binding transcriptional LysR family regulator